MARDEEAPRCLCDRYCDVECICDSHPDIVCPVHGTTYKGYNAEELLPKEY
jgi:hypothetical protein